MSQARTERTFFADESCPLQRCEDARQGEVKLDVVALGATEQVVDAGPVEQLLQLVPRVLAEPAGAGGQTVGDGQRVGVAREAGVVAEGGQAGEGGLGVGAGRQVDPEGERHSGQPFLRVHRRVARATDEHAPVRPWLDPSHRRVDPWRHLGRCRVAGAGRDGIFLGDQ